MSDVKILKLIEKQNSLEKLVKASTFKGYRNAMGLVSDSLKLTDEYKLAKYKSCKAFKALQDFNLNLTKKEQKGMAKLRMDIRVRDLKIRLNPTSV